jgi:hypothetical protein
MLGRRDTFYKTDWRNSLKLSGIQQALASIDPIPSIGVSCNTSDVESGTLISGRNRATSVDCFIPAPNVAFGNSRAARTLLIWTISLSTVAAGCSLGECKISSCHKQQFSKIDLHMGHVGRVPHI